MTIRPRRGSAGMGKRNAGALGRALVPEESQDGLEGLNIGIQISCQHPILGALQVGPPART